MKKITLEELKEKIALHKLWLKDSPKGKRLVLKGYDLRECNFSYSDFSYSDFRNSDFRHSNFSDCDFSNCDFRNCDFRNCDFSYSDFRNSNFRHSNFSDSNLTNIITNEWTLCYHLACPEEGSFTGYKKAHNMIVKLLITEDSLRSSATSLKCRCSKAKVISITDKEGNEHNEVASDYDSTFIYKKGEIIEVKDFDTDRWNECSKGIHFFINKQIAINY